MINKRIPVRILNKTSSSTGFRFLNLFLLLFGAPVAGKIGATVTIKSGAISAPAIIEQVALVHFLEGVTNLI